MNVNWFDAEVHVARSRAAADRMAQSYAREQHIATEREQTQRFLAAAGALLIRWGYRLQGQTVVVVEVPDCG